MNFWGFSPAIFSALQAYFEDFLTHKAGGDITAECLLPVMVNDFLSEGSLTVEVLRSTDQWFGMTYQQDRAAISEALTRLHETGIYPSSLRT